MKTFKQLIGKYLQNKTKDRQYPETEYLDILRVFACLAVIIYHVISSIILLFSSSLSGMDKYICVILYNIWLWHVPTFLMISGVLLLNKDKEISLKKLYKKYILRIVLALLIFGIPFALMELFFDAHYQFSIDQIGTSLVNVFQGKLWDHMWYLYMLIGLYMMLPLFKIFVNNSNRKILEYAIGILFVFTSIIPTFQKIFGLNIGIYIPINSVYVFYIFLGYYIHYYNIRIKNSLLYLISLIYIIYAILMPLNENFVTGSDGREIIGLYENISPLIAMITFCIFCYVRQNINLNRVYELISPQVFGMYLIHPLFINFMFKFIKFSPDKYPLIMIIVCTIIITTILSLLFSLIARKIKVIKAYVL